MLTCPHCGVSLTVSVSLAKDVEMEAIAVESRIKCNLWGVELMWRKEVVRRVTDMLLEFGLNIRASNALYYLDVQDAWQVGLIPYLWSVADGHRDVRGVGPEGRERLKAALLVLEQNRPRLDALENLVGPEYARIHSGTLGSGVVSS